MPSIELHRISAFTKEGFARRYIVDVTTECDGIEERTTLPPFTREDLLMLAQLIKEELSL